MSDPPFFSVIIPAFARPVRIAACLGALTGLDYPPERFEAIVVDDGSPEPLEPVVVRFRSQLDLTMLRQGNTGPAAARNAGALAARGRYLAFTDDDCLPEPGWLRALASALTQDPSLLVGGRVINAFPQSPYATASQDILDYRYGHFDDDRGWTPFFTSNNIALAADRFRAIGGFDALLPLAAFEDRDFCDRWRARNWPMRYESSAIVRHAHDLSLSSFWRQHFRYGRGAAHLHRARVRCGAAGLRPKPFGFYADMLRYPFRYYPAAAATLGAGLIALSQAATAVGFMWETISRVRYLGKEPLDDHGAGAPP